jgi:probable HAF family extracellular repeat protein
VQARAIDNTNAVSGYATDATGSLLTDNEFRHPQVGPTTLLQNPTTVSYLHGIAQGMNNLGAIVGDFFTGSGTQRHGFILNGSSFTELQLPGLPNDRVAARGITNSGTVVGWDVRNGVQEGFVYKNGSFSFVSDPNAVGITVLESINNHGIASGEWSDAAGNSHGFIYDTVHGLFTEINVPGAANVSAFGINDLGQVILTTDLATGPNNFIYSTGGVPEPATWALMIAGAFGLGAALRRRRALGLRPA